MPRKEVDAFMRKAEFPSVKTCIFSQLSWRRGMVIAQRTSEKQERTDTAQPSWKQNIAQVCA